MDSEAFRKGNCNARFFVDLTLFEHTTPAWIVLGDKFVWRHERLSIVAPFAPVKEILNRRHGDGGPIGILDGVQVAQKLSLDRNVMKALRAAQKP